MDAIGGFTFPSSPIQNPASSSFGKKAVVGIIAKADLLRMIIDGENDFMRL